MQRWPFFIGAHDHSPLLNFCFSKNTSGQPRPGAEYSNAKEHPRIGLRRISQVGFRKRSGLLIFELHRHLAALRNAAGNELSSTGFSLWALSWSGCRKIHRLKSVLPELPHDYFKGFGVAGWAIRLVKAFSSDGSQISSTISSCGRSFIILCGPTMG